MQAVFRRPERLALPDQEDAVLVAPQLFGYRTVASLSVDRQREIEHLTYAKSDYRDAELIARLGAEGEGLHSISHPRLRASRALANIFFTE